MIHDVVKTVVVIFIEYEGRLRAGRCQKSRLIITHLAGGKERERGFVLGPSFCFVLFCAAHERPEIGHGGG